VSACLRCGPPKAAVLRRLWPQSGHLSAHVEGFAHPPAALRPCRPALKGLFEEPLSAPSSLTLERRRAYGTYLCGWWCRVSVVVAAGEDPDSVIHDLIDEAVFVVDAAGPAVGEIVL
jgi:hypothetical protein